MAYRPRINPIVETGVKRMSYVTIDGYRRQIWDGRLMMGEMGMGYTIGGEQVLAPDTWYLMPVVGVASCVAEWRAREYPEI